MNNPKIENDPADVGDAALLTHEQVLYVIGYGKDPAKIANQVQRSLQHNPNLSEAAKEAILEAVKERNELEKGKKQKKSAHGAKRIKLEDSDYNLRGEHPWLQLEVPMKDNIQETEGNPNPAPTTAGAGGKKTAKRKAKKKSDQNKDIKRIVHSRDTLIQSLLPSAEQFLRILAVRDKFAERAENAIRCLMAYKILGDHKVHIDEIAQIHELSVQFKHTGIVPIARLLPVVEERDVDEDVFGEWLEDMENWHEPLPESQRLKNLQQIAADTIAQTLQTGPPLDHSAGYTHRDLVVRPEQIAQLLSGLSGEEFAEVISGMFVTFDFSELRCAICLPNNGGYKKLKKKKLFPLPISAVTFDAPTATPMPFLFVPNNCTTSNARLHIDPRVHLVERGNKRKRITALPIPQTEQLLDLQRFNACCSCLRDKMDFVFPSMDYVETKVKRLWQALEKAKAGAQPNGANACVAIKVEQQ